MWQRALKVYSFNIVITKMEMLFELSGITWSPIKIFTERKECVELRTMNELLYDYCINVFPGERKF